MARVNSLAEMATYCFLTAQVGLCMDFIERYRLHLHIFISKL